MKKNKNFFSRPKFDEMDIEQLLDTPFYYDKAFLRMSIEKRLKETKRRLDLTGAAPVDADFFEEKTGVEEDGALIRASSDERADDTTPETSGDDGRRADPSPMVTRAFQSNKVVSFTRHNTKGKSFAGGYDGGCEISYYIRYNEDAHKKLVSELERYKEFAKKLRSNGKPADACIFEIGKIGKWEVLPYGTAGGVRYAYQIRRNGVTLCIHSSASDAYPQFRAVFGYESFRNGEKLIDLSQEIKKIISLLGAEVKKEVLSRVDIEITTDISIEAFANAFYSNRWISRVRNWTIYTKREAGTIETTGLTGGKSLKIRIYDKYQELLDKPGPQTEQKMADLSQYFDTLDELTRVEFQLRRTFLKSIGVESCEDFERDLEGILEYLTRDWLRILDREKVRGMEKKQEIDEIWKFVRNAFFITFERARDEEDEAPREAVKPRKEKRIEETKLFAQAIGCLTSCFAWRGETSELKFVEYIKNFLEANYAEFYNGARRKMEFFQNYLKKYPELLTKTTAERMVEMDEKGCTEWVG